MSDGTRIRGEERLEQGRLSEGDQQRFRHRVRRDSAERLRAPLLMLTLAAVVWLPACRSVDPFDAIRSEDTLERYYRFVRESPDSPHLPEAMERMAVLRIKRSPSFDDYGAFKQEYPDSVYFDELRPLLEDVAFRTARAAGTPDAYTQFLEEFPGGVNALRAAGNRAFVEAAGFGGRTVELRDFAAEHPKSDFAAEARRSVANVETRDTTRFRMVGLVIDIEGAPEPDRLAAQFTKRAMDAYSFYGVKLVPVSQDAPNSSRTPRARLTIRHREEQISAQRSAALKPQVVATTDVTLQSAPDVRPAWERSFTLPVDERSHVPNTSVLFSATTAPSYWASFYVPVATWQTSAAVRSASKLRKTVSAVSAAGDRVVVLYEDGDFDLLELADPHAPALLAPHKREKSDRTRWTDLTILGDRVAVFGEAGLEVVRFTSDGPEEQFSKQRGEVGSLLAVESYGDYLLLGGSFGLQLLHPSGGEPVRFFSRVPRGLATVGSLIVFTQGSSVHISTAKLLKQNKRVGSFDLGKTFKPGRVRAFDSTVLVMGENGVASLDLSNPRNPRVDGILRSREVGRIHDATMVRGRVFLLGTHGLLALNAKRNRISEVIAVETEGRMATMGRHLVTVGGDVMQVVDGTPFTARSIPAAPDPQSESSAQSPAMMTPDASTKPASQAGPRDRAVGELAPAEADFEIAEP